MNALLLSEFCNQFAEISVKNNFLQLKQSFPELDSSNPENCLTQLFSLQIKQKSQDYYFQKLMAPVLRAICMTHLRAQETEEIVLIYTSYEEDLTELAKDGKYSPTEFITVLRHALELSVSCINIETTRELVEANSDSTLNFKIYLDPDTRNNQKNAHFYVHPDDANSTFADGNCLYHTFAQCLKMKFMHEQGINNPYYNLLFKYQTGQVHGLQSYSFIPEGTVDQEPPGLPIDLGLGKRISFFSPERINTAANAVMGSGLVGVCFTLSGLVALSIPLWMSISATFLLLGLAIKLANDQNIGHAKLTCNQL